MVKNNFQGNNSNYRDKKIYYGTHWGSPSKKRLILKSHFLKNATELLLAG